MEKIKEVIQKAYPSWFDSEFELSYDDQKFIWENMPLPKEDERKLKKTTDNDIVNGSVNGDYKRFVKSGLIWSKPDVVLRLKQYTYETPPNEIAALLEELFSQWPSKDGHWLWVAQRYTPRVINWLVSKTEREHLSGGIRTTPPAYFTYNLRFRKKRKPLRSTNGTRKQLNL